MNAPKPFGCYWELFHVLSGEVVNSGFERDSVVPQPGEWKCKVRGFDYRFTPLYEAPTSDRSHEQGGLMNAQERIELRNAWNGYRSSAAAAEHFVSGHRIVSLKAAKKRLAEQLWQHRDTLVQETTESQRK